MQTLNGTTQTIGVGESFLITLHEGAATPYLWKVDTVSEPSRIHIAEHYVPAQTDALGATGQKIFTITALENGLVFLRLKLWDQWQNHVQETFEINFNIQ